MANVFTPFGFRQTMGTGSAPTYEQVVAVVDSGASAIYFGDVVTRVAAGSVEAIAADVDPIAGIFVGCKYLSTSQKRTVWSNYWPGTDSAYPVEAYIVNDPNAKFSVQSSGMGGVTLAMSGQNVAFDLGTLVPLLTFRLLIPRQLFRSASSGLITPCRRGLTAPAQVSSITRLWRLTTSKPSRLPARSKGVR
jgi:hypothetical protein